MQTSAEFMRIRRPKISEKREPWLRQRSACRLAAKVNIRGLMHEPGTFQGNKPIGYEGACPFLQILIKDNLIM
jgi:hypothetical protein